jgi:hypothetical protein
VFRLGGGHSSSPRTRSRATTSGPVRRVGHHGVRTQLRADLIHRAVQIDVQDIAAEALVSDVGQKAGRAALELFEEHTIGVDLRQHLPIG